MVLHLGDLSRDAVLLSSLISSLPFKIVNGNNDFRPELPSELLIEIAGKKVFLCHGHQYRVKSGLDAFASAALKKGADLALFGHTHLPFCDIKNGMYLLNPGSAHRPDGSYGTVDISATGIQIRTIPIDKGGEFYV